MWGELKMSSKCSVGEWSRIIEFHAEKNSVTDMSRDTTQRNMGIPKELFLK